MSYSRLSLMIIASRTQFLVYLPWGQCPFSIVSFNSVLILGAFSEIVKTDCKTDGSFYSTKHYITATDTVCTDLDNVSPAIVSVIRVEEMMGGMRDGITTRFKLSQYFIPL